mgnify:CR=1 FL=1
MEITKILTESIILALQCFSKIAYLCVAYKQQKNVNMCYILILYLASKVIRIGDS